MEPAPFLHSFILSEYSLVAFFQEKSPNSILPIANPQLLSFLFPFYRLLSTLYFPYFTADSGLYSFSAAFIVPTFILTSNWYGILFLSVPIKNFASPIELVT